LHSRRTPGINPAVTPVPLLIVYCLLILIASLAGGWVPSLFRLTHTRLQVAISLVAGLMLGVGVLHLLPHAWFELGSVDRAAGWLLTGFLVMFLVQRFFHFHHHDVPDEAVERAGCCGEHDHDQAHGHAHDTPPEPPHRHDTLAAKSARRLSWGGAAFGMALHTILDGMALAASVEAEAHGGAGAGLLGLGTFLVVILHKPFDAMAITTLMAAGGWSRSARHWVNAAFAMIMPLGVLLFHFGAGQFQGPGHVFLGSVLAFSAGTFLCIAASDLLPELQFHAHDRVKLSAALLAGLLLSVLIGRFETTGHDHLRPAAPGADAPHDHAGEAGH
jgi:zinc and cadmium transporter